MDTQKECSTEARKRRLAELDRITATQTVRNGDLTEEQADALIQRYLAEDRAERSQSTRATKNDPKRK